MLCPQCHTDNLIITSTDLLGRDKKVKCLACGFWCWLKYLKKTANKLNK